MKNIGLIALMVFSFFGTAVLNAQNKEENEVKRVITELFDGMRAGDSSKVSKLFHPEVRMLTSYRDSTDRPVLKEGSLQGFLKAIGTAHPEVWDERIQNTQVRIDDDLAQLWTEYAFYVGEKFSHCGVDAFQLTRDADGEWRIINLVDTRRKEPCDWP